MHKKSARERERVVRTCRGLQSMRSVTSTSRMRTAYLSSIIFVRVARRLRSAFMARKTSPRTFADFLLLILCAARCSPRWTEQGGYSCLIGGTTGSSAMTLR